MDTEEDAWEPTRGPTTARNVRALPGFQERVETYGVKPTYLVTHSVLGDPEARELLRAVGREGRGELGAHLHPWNTPPLRESFSERNTNLAQLPERLQREKLATLTRRIEDELEVRPRAFRAGRWAASPASMRALLAEGYEVDTSVLPFMYWHDVPWGPSNWHAPTAPYRLDGRGDIQTPVPAGALLEVPPTVGYTRGPWRWMGPLDRLWRTAPLRPFHVPGVLSRSGIVDRIPLSPEESTLEGMLRLVDVALGRRLPVFNVFLHSTSLAPGISPRFPTASRVDELLERTEGILAHLTGEAGAEPVTLRELVRRFPRRSRSRPADA